MDIELLKTFLILAELKNFSRTAEFQHVVQSTISTRIHDLEASVGRALFIRNNRQVELTKEGASFLPYAKRIIKLYEDSIIKLRTTPYFEDYLVIGTIDSIYRFNLVEIIKKFLNHYPMISFRSFSGHSQEIIQQLLDGTVDIGFVSTAPRLNKIEVLPCFADQFVLVVSHKHELSSKSSITIKELIKNPLLFADFGGSFSEWASEIFSSGHPFRLQIDPTSLLIPFIKAGLGPGLTLRSLVEKDLQTGELIEIPITGNNPPPKWETYAIIDKQKMGHPAIQKLISLINESSGIHAFKKSDY